MVIEEIRELRGPKQYVDPEKTKSGQAAAAKAAKFHGGTHDAERGRI